MGPWLPGGLDTNSYSTRQQRPRSHQEEEQQGQLACGQQPQVAGAVSITGEPVLVRGPCQGSEITKETSRSDSGAHTRSQYQVASPWMFTEQAKLHLAVELESMAFKLECER